MEKPFLKKEWTMPTCKRKTISRSRDIFSLAALAFLLVVLPASTGYAYSALIGHTAWSGAIIGLMVSVIIFLSLIVLLGATLRFPDHLPGPEYEIEIVSNKLYHDSESSRHRSL